MDTATKTRVFRLRPDGRRVALDWYPDGRRAAVFTRHETPAGPQEVLRGRIAGVPSSDPAGRMAWELRTDEGEQVGDGPFVGDLVDAERVLLDATPWFDEPWPDDRKVAPGDF